jgi:hypothetical protein
VKSKRKVIEGLAGPVRIKVLDVAIEVYCDDSDIEAIRVLADRSLLDFWALTAEEIVRRDGCSVSDAIRIAADRIREQQPFSH